MSLQLPIAILITSRCKELGLSRPAFIARCGYNNTTKGLRRLDALMTGNVLSTRGLIARLPLALEVPIAVITDAVHATQITLDAHREATERASFVPHAILLTERSVPSSITLAAFTGALKWLRVDFRPDSDPNTFVEQVQIMLKHRLGMLGGVIPFFGHVTGFVINYRYDLSVQYDLDGRVFDAQPKMKKAAVVTFGRDGGRSLLPVFKP